LTRWGGAKRVDQPSRNAAKINDHTHRFELGGAQTPDELFLLLLQITARPRLGDGDEVFLNGGEEDLGPQGVPGFGDGRVVVGRVDFAEVGEKLMGRLVREEDLALDETFAFGGKDLEKLRVAEEGPERLAFEVLEGLWVSRATISG
jgi:hypothetical protein